MLSETTKKFRAKVASLPREDILEILNAQDPDIVEQVLHIEEVFRTKLSHLKDKDGEPITGRPMTNKELALLVDEPFEYSVELAQMGLDLKQQQNLHIASDPVTWTKHFLNAKPRVYQILMMRHPNLFKVLRAGRRLGKTWTMAALLLHYSYITKNGRALVVTPMKPQAGLIYEAIMEMAAESDIVMNSITRYVTAPQYEINFKNGASIRFFTSGMKSGGKSDVTRGQEAHFIVLDELDYMGDDDLDALLAMMQKTSENQPEKRMIGASTPSGRRGTFWKWCVQSSRFHEFYFPSYCNPFWDEDMEEFAREEYRTESAYRHEIEADWGDDAQGVYPRRFVDPAFKDPGWAYVPGLTSAHSIYVMGVDWDKIGAGTNMVVLEYFPHNHPEIQMRGMIKVCHREEIPSGEYTLTVAVDRIIQLHKNFKFKHIYVDKGYGETQVELLKKEGLNTPGSNLHKVVKDIAFGGTIEMRDPFTMQKDKKETKHFMVDTLRVYLERGEIIFPAHDEELYMELISYIAPTTTGLGKPKYEMSTAGVFDHAHDALILACLALYQNYGDLMKTNYATRARVVSSETFLPLLGISDDPGQAKAEKKIAEDKWGKETNGPVQIRRPLSVARRRGAGIHRRKSF